MSLLLRRSAANRRVQRKVLAVVLAAVAVGAIIVEPFPRFFVLLAISKTHGIDAGDVPAIMLLGVAAWLAL